MRIHEISKLEITRTATRPIRLDRRLALESIDRLKAFLQDGYYARHSDEPIGEAFVFLDRVNLTGVDGKEFEVQVHYKSWHSSSKDMVLGGGSGQTHISRKPAVVVLINSRIAPRVFTLYALGERLTNSLLEVLEHELTHQADIFKKEVKPSSTRQKIPSINEIDNKVYFNDPAEVRAYMRSVFDEVETYLPSASKVFTPRQVLDGLKGGSSTWVDIVKHLTEDNKRLILKGVYQAVVDWYDQHGGKTE